jgi:maltooligosyltrehalose synthase
VVIVPRLYARLLGEREDLPLGEAVWGDTAIELPRRLDGAALRNVLDGSVIHAEARAGVQLVAASRALASFPVALLTSASP